MPFQVLTHRPIQRKNMRKCSSYLPKMSDYRKKMAQPFKQIKKQVEVVKEDPFTFTLYETRKVYIWGAAYEVKIPEYCEFMVAMEFCYPHLYKEMMDEQEYIHRSAVHEEYDENSVEYMDYIEWLHD